MNATDLAHQLQEFLDRVGGPHKGKPPIKPDHYTPWHWPPHSVSFDYHLVPEDWNSETTLELAGKTVKIEVASTAHGVFGRSVELQHDARGNDLHSMLEAFKKRAEPLLSRQRKIAEALELPGLVSQSIRTLSPFQKLQLLFAADRAIARDAQSELEVGGHTDLLGPALLVILADNAHPYRRQAQWSVLDMFEDLPAFFPTEEGQRHAVDAIVNFMSSAEDDYARSVFKAGVVLGGHICSDYSTGKVLELIKSPSKYARRSAIHTVFHTREWLPHTEPQIMAALAEAAKNDPEPLLQTYAKNMAEDILEGGSEHTLEPTFPDED